MESMEGVFDSEGESPALLRGIDLFWPEMELEAGRVNLSTILTSLRRQIEPSCAPAGSVLIADRQTIGLNAAVVTTDLQDFDNLLKAAARAGGATERIVFLERAIELVRGDIAPGCYDDWAASAQTYWRERYLDTMQQLLEVLEAEGDWERALTTARRLIHADPYREEAYQTQMRLHGVTRTPILWGRGDREEAYQTQMRLQARPGRATAALVTYQNLERLLKQNLGVLPDAQTRRLAEQIRRDPTGLQTEPQRQGNDEGPGRKHTRETGKESAPERKEPQKVPATPPATPCFSSLPLQLTQFFGREAEIAQLEAMLLQPHTRLITLMGSGGAGKTRLAIAAGDRVTPRFEGRVWFVPLADLPDAGLVPVALINALKLSPSTGSDPLERIAEYLGPQPALLILDNFEHLLRPPGFPGKSDQPSGDATIFLRLMLQRIPQLTCLVTSRQTLRLGGEQEFPLPPLALPQETAVVEPVNLLANASVALYADRARAVKPDFALTYNNAGAVVALCRRLEGMPLAIEMAAAWAKMLPPMRMLERLEQQLDLLVSRRRDLPARHQSLRATIEWSYDMLSADLQQTFRYLSVFRGGWDLEAAEAICGPDALELLEELQSRSMIVAEEGEETSLANAGSPS